MEQIEPKTVNIQPISKGKRLLVYLADFFLTFILTFVVFNALVMPIGNLITDYSCRQQKNDDAAQAQFNILYEEKVMLHENDSDLFSYNKNVEYTMNCYLSYYAFDEGDILETHPQYGHKLDNEVIKHFYYDIRNNSGHYITTLQTFNNEHPYFVINDTDIALKDDVKTNIKLSFFSPNDMSADGKTMLGDLQNLFMNLYADVFKDIEQNDLLHNNASYLANKKIVNDMESYMHWQLVVSALISYLVSVGIYFVLLPLIIKDNRTLAMLMMRVTRIGTNNMFLLSKVENVLNAIYMVPFNLPVAFFMPMTYVTFTYLFNLPVLPALLVVGAVIIVISLFFVLFTAFNQTLCDKLSRSVIIKNEELDEIYRAKGYDI